MKKLIVAMFVATLILLLTGSAFADIYFDVLFTTGQPWGMSAKQIIAGEQTTDYTDKTIGDLQELGFKPDKTVNYQYYLRNDKLIAGVLSISLTGNKKEKEFRFNQILISCEDYFGTEWALTKKEVNTTFSDLAKGLGLPKNVTNVKKYTKEQKAWYNEDKTVFMFLSSKYECKIFYLVNPDIVK